MKQFDYTIKDSLGIHARPAGLLSKAAKAFESKVTLTKGDKEVDVTRLMQLMQLGVKCDDTVTVKVEGADEEACFAEMEKFFNENL